MTYCLGLLDKSPIPQGDTPEDGLARTVAFAQRAESLGYHRFWVAEHHGFAGWNAVTSPLEGSGLNHGKPHPEHALRYEIAGEYLDVVKGLWDSWDDDAFVRDRASGAFFDRAKLHTLGHKSRFFQVEGPLNIGRSPQGQTVIFQAGASDAGIGLAGRHADAVFTDDVKLEDAVAFRAQVRASAVAHGRRADEVLVFPGIGPIVGRTAAEAEEKHRIIRGLVTVGEALLYLGRFFDHHDFSQHDLDAPFPELGDIGRNSFRSTTDRIKADAKARNLTLRQAALNAATPKADLIGLPEQVADEILRRVDAGAADGFILGFSVIAEGAEDFIRDVLPILEERGAFRRELPGRTLRDHLGLPFRQSRHAAEPAPRRAATA